MSDADDAFAIAWVTISLVYSRVFLFRFLRTVLHGKSRMRSRATANFLLATLTLQNKPNVT